MSKTQQARVDNLEKRSGDGEIVHAVRYGDEPTVRVSGSGEVLTLAEFKEKYPDGVIIHVVYLSMDALYPDSLSEKHPDS